MKPRIYIGTSGWNYDHWKNVFYHTDCPKSQWLEFYSRRFSTVEVNATFYRLPKPATFENWRRRTPEHFLWAVKASRYITHTKRLQDPVETLSRFVEAAELLGTKLGPILFQLPSSLSYEEARAEEFFRSVSRFGHRSVLEVRHSSWIEDHAIELLKKYNIALCVSDTAGRYPYYEAVTADFMYVRLHGSPVLYESDYKDEELCTWAEKITEWKRDTYVYFDNDAEGYAPVNAAKLREFLDHP